MGFMVALRDDRPLGFARDLLTELLGVKDHVPSDEVWGAVAPLDVQQLVSLIGDQHFRKAFARLAATCNVPGASPYRLAFQQLLGDEDRRRVGDAYATIRALFDRDSPADPDFARALCLSQAAD